MAFANSSYSDMLATTIEHRSKKVADNVKNNNALLSRLQQKGNTKTFSGGHKILEPLSFAENKNTGWYQGYDLLPVGVSDVISAAEFEIKQAAVPVVMSGLEMLKNASKEAIIDLMEARLKVAETSMVNLLSSGIYSDGTGSGGKEITGLDAMIPVDPTAASYGGIDGSAYSFWQNYSNDTSGLDATSVQGAMNTAWANLVNGMERPDLILMDNGFWLIYLASLQADQRFSNTSKADAGFVTIKFMDADVVLDGGMYGSHAATDIPAEDYITGASGVINGTTNTALFINSNYMRWRPHAKRNMVPLSPNRRYATNQDAEVQILAWAGNLCCSGRKYHGRIDNNA